MKKFLPLTLLVVFCSFSINNILAQTITNGAISGAYNSVYGTTSPGSTFTVAGTGITVAGILVTAPASFEVSLDNVTYAPSVLVPGTGTILSTTIYFRVLVTKNAGTYSGTMALTSTGATTVFVASTTCTVAKKALTVTPPTMSSRVYNGTMAPGALSAITLSAANGLIGTEDLTVTTVAGNFASADVGIHASALTYTLLNGVTGLAANYSLANVSVNGTISAKSLTAVGTIADKIYNGSNVAGAVTVGTISGNIAGETPTITGVGSIYGSADVGTYSSTITYTVSDNLPFKASNYSLTANATANGNITPKPLTMSAAPSIAPKVYDGFPTAGVLTIGSIVPAGFVAGETVTTTAAASDYSGASVALHYSSIVTYTLANGTGGGKAINYSIAPVTLNDLSITKKNVTWSGTPVVADKPYDGTATVPNWCSGVTVLGTVGTETLTVTCTGTPYVGVGVPHVGSYTTTLTLLLASGTGWQGNYNLLSPTAIGVSGNIVKKWIATGTATIADKQYDGNPTTGAITLAPVTGLVGSETITVNVTPVTLYASYVGMYVINIPCTLADGPAGPNQGKATDYAIVDATGVAYITPKILTPVGLNSLNTIASKVYDGTTATGAVTVGKTFTGQVGSQQLTITAVGVFNVNGNVGIGKACTLKYTVGDGPTNDKGFNYIVNDETGYVADVTARPVTISGITAADKTKPFANFTATTLSGTPFLKNVVPADAAGITITGAGIVTANFLDVNVGQGKPIVLTGSYSISGGQSANYTLSQPVLTASIAAAAGEIGNRVWDDVNANGIQDDGEMGIAGVKVHLLNAAYGLIDSAITDAHGYYIFSADSIEVSTASARYHVTGLIPGTHYILRVPHVGAPNKQNVLGLKTLTLAGQGTDPNKDSDGILNGESADAPIIAPATGVNDYSTDFGFTSGAPGGGGGGGVGGGGGGGLESKSLGDAVGNRVYNNAINSTHAPVDYTKLPSIVNNGIRRGVMGVGTQLTLRDLLPTQITGTNYQPFVSTPADLTSITNAKDVLSIDFTSNNQAKAVAFGLRTSGEVYDHTKAICDRLKGSELQSIESIVINKIPMVSYKMKNNLGQTEYVMSFAIGAKTGRSFYTIQSKWLNRDYTSDEVMYNIQLWADSKDLITTMATDMLSRLTAGQAVEEIVNTKGLPSTFVTKGNRASDKIVLEVNNSTNITNGYFEISEKANEQSVSTGKKQIPFTLNAKGLTSVNIPTTDIYESTLSLYLNGVLQDEVFIADGNWAAQVNASTGTIKSFRVTNDPAVVTDNKDDFKLFRNVQVEASTPDFVSVYKMLRGGGAAQNLTGYKSFQFTASGSGATMFITLVRDGIPNWADQYSLSLPLSSTSQDYKISLDDFTSTATKDKIDPKDITMVIFGLVVNGGKLSTVTADISKVAFSKTDIAYLNSLQSKELGVYPNPAKGGTFTATFKAAVANKLMLNVTDINTGKVVFSKSVNAQVGTNNVPVTVDQKTGLNTYILSLEGSGIRYTPKKVFMER